jgi:predicted transcriptional regulator
MVGRPLTGLRPGEKASEYKQLTVRLPDETLSALNAIGRVVSRPMWRVMVDAVAAYLGDGEALSESDRRLARALLRREP